MTNKSECAVGYCTLYGDMCGEIVGLISAALDVIDKVVAQGDVCAKNECAVAGCFRVVNTGDFDSKTMARAHTMVERAAELVNAAGFGEVCYGDAYITQRLKREVVLAFYMQTEDRMYVRAKPKKGEDALEVETIVHELGHRLDTMFLTKEGQRLNERVYGDFRHRLEVSKIANPLDVREGYEFVDSLGRKYVVDQVLGLYEVHYHRVEDPCYKGKMAWKAFQVSEGARMEDDPFPTHYARKDATEMFAELFLVYVMGRATAEQREVFERIAALRKPAPATARASGMSRGTARRTLR